MTKYRARSCPNCDYFLGFAVAQPPAPAKLLPITNFCLNCSYKLPVHSIVLGVERPSRQPRRSHLRLVQGARPTVFAGGKTPASIMGTETTISSQSYARHLRVIGQDLEHSQFEAFNLECTSDGYLVWVISEATSDQSHPLLRVGKSRLQKLWRNNLLSRTIARQENYHDAQGHTRKRLRYYLEDLERMEREQRSRRRQHSGGADGHMLSQLLRTVGDLVTRRSERLLGISWQSLSISIVVETPQGRKEIEVFRPDNLYDLWVRMYLRRDHRASSDSPR